MSWYISEYIAEVKRRQAAQDKLLRELIDFEVKFKGIRSRRMGIHMSAVFFQVDKSELKTLRQRGVNWDRDKIEMSGVVNPKAHTVMYWVPISDCLRLEWIDVYEPGPDDPCQWVTEKYESYQVEGCDYTTLECKR